MLHGAPAVVYSFEAGGEYAPTFVSDNIKRVLGYEPDQYLKDPDFWRSRVHPEDLPAVEEHDVPHLVRVAGEDARGRRVDVPDARRLVVARGREAPAVRRDRRVVDVRLVPAVGPRDPARLRVGREPPHLAGVREIGRQHLEPRQRLVRIALQRALLARGIQARHVARCATASALRGPFRVGVFDLDLPDGDGVELAQQLTRSGVVQRAIFYTACAHPARLADASAIGAVFAKSKQLGSLMEMLTPSRSVRETCVSAPLH